MQIIIDRDRCIASGQCVLSASDVFDQGEEDGLVILLNEHPSADQLADVKTAANLCPALAITVEE
jgi:ferredoxin